MQKTTKQMSVLMAIAVAVLAGINGFMSSYEAETSPAISPAGVVTVSGIVRVYDGDTFYCNIDSWPDILGKNIGIRLAGIDTPEIRGTTGRENDLAKEAKLFAQSEILTALKIELHNIKRGKYFRIIADVSVDGNDLSTLLLDAGLAKPYDGGTRPEWGNDNANTDGEN